MPRRELIVTYQRRLARHAPARSPRCPYCHDLAREETRRCEGCDAALHTECWALHGRCAACGRPAHARFRLSGASRRLVARVLRRCRDTWRRRVGFALSPSVAASLAASLLCVGLLALAPQPVDARQGAVLLLILGGSLLSALAAEAPRSHG